MKRLTILLVSILLLVLMMPASAVLASPGLTTTDLGPGLTPEDLVQTLLGAGVEVQNVSFVGTTQSAGTFGGGAGIIDFNEGIILSSGFISNVIGPNVDDGITGMLALPGDADLDALIPQSTYDATVLEFDFRPTFDNIVFEYVFSSDEYNEYVHSAFNDVFAFFLNGVNVALIPGTMTPVSINNVNNGNPYGTNPVNPHLYRNNDLDDGGGSIDTEMDGLTVVLSVNANVDAGQWNHIKLAIADAGDDILDSNVFIKAESFVSVPDLHLKPHTDTNKVGEEHCFTANYTVDNQPMVDEPIHFEVISGPHVGNDHDTVTDGTGIASWCYTGTDAGTDEIVASVIGTDIVSNTVIKIWEEEDNGEEPPIEVGGDVSSVNKLTLLLPWIALGAVAIIIAGVTLAVRRRRI